MVENFNSASLLNVKQSREKPWMAFLNVDNYQTMHSKASMVQRIMPSYTESWWRNLAQSAGKQENYPLSHSSPVAHSLVHVSFGKSNDDIAYGALMSATKAAIGIADWLDITTARDKNDDLRFYSIVIPVIVLDAPLFGCHLDKDSNELVITRITRCTLEWGNQIGRMPTTIIEIVTKDSLPNFLKDMNHALSGLQRLANQ